MQKQPTKASFMSQILALAPGVTCSYSGNQKTIFIHGENAEKAELALRRQCSHIPFKLVSQPGGVPEPEIVVPVKKRTNIKFAHRSLHLTKGGK